MTNTTPGKEAREAEETAQASNKKKRRRRVYKGIRRIEAYLVTHLCGHGVIVLKKSSFDEMRAMTHEPCDECKGEY